MLKLATFLASFATVAQIAVADAAAQSPSDLSTRDNLTARRAAYSISMDHPHCLYRNKIRLFCHENGGIAFEQRVKTRDYDLIVVSLPPDGQGLRSWDWKLIVEDGKQAAIKPLADQCHDDCNIRVEKLNPHLNQVNFDYRLK